MKNSNGEMTFKQHLAELRNRALWCVGFFLVAFCVCFCFRNQIVTYFLALGVEVGYQFVFASPEEVLVQQIRLAVMGAVVLAMPFLVVQLIVFVTAGQKRAHKRVALFCGFLAICCYAFGGLFGFKQLIPITLKFLEGVSQTSMVQGLVSVEKFVTFVMTFTLGLGLVFEVPVICASLAFCKLITVHTLRKVRSYAVVVIFIVAAIITPPDVISQLMVATPMVILYELSIVIVFLIEKLKGRSKYEQSVRAGKE